MRGCDERARNLERQHLPSSCDRHARLRGRNIPNQPYDDVHPALRRGPKSPSPAPRMFGTLRNPARDLESINMPSARSRRGSEEPRFYSNMRNISEIPHMPQFASSHGRRGSAGISKHGNARKASYSEVQREATYQRQADVRSKRHHYQQCERLVASGRYSQNELSDHPLIQQLSEQDRFTLFYDAEQREREREGERRSRRRGDGQKSRCVVM
ncbi:hypothetical protein EDD36DRAFT_459823 [Exophiala viscosa]|uniref:Uncharacterized protein n=2 Tax=Exophiala viscosa TaxID=2486360 RepID=A0AAN6E7E6_9EURO|nr:hypothetical protein EDD36DRAFT_459823 [Exophiala viscosa]